MNAEITLQRASKAQRLPDDDTITAWADLALKTAPMLRPDYNSISADMRPHITLRIIDAEEMCELNRTYRNKPNPTNVLSFPFEAPIGLPIESLDELILGDIAICAPIVDTEASQQNKSREAHWAHMVIHGTLHLLGYDHIEADEAEIMETLEIQLLKEAGFANPYFHSLQPPSCNLTNDSK